MSKFPCQPVQIFQDILGTYLGKVGDSGATFDCFSISTCFQRVIPNLSSPERHCHSVPGSDATLSLFVQIRISRRCCYAYNLYGKYHWLPYCICTGIVCVNLRTRLESRHYCQSGQLADRSSSVNMNHCSFLAGFRTFSLFHPDKVQEQYPRRSVSLVPSPGYLSSYLKIDCLISYSTIDSSTSPHRPHSYTR